MYRYRILLHVKPENSFGHFVYQSFYRGVKPAKIVNIYPSHPHAFMATIE